jgi:3-dehydroquinate dehydratase-2
MADTVGSTILVLNGPNLNLLGAREPDVYGTTTFEDIKSAVTEHANTLGMQVDFRQSNTEGEIVEWVQSANQTASAVIINAGAYTHTSIAILDALLACGLPVIEVHLSNIFRREEFRHHSYISQAATGIICGFGAQGYLLALDAAKVTLARP